MTMLSEAVSYATGLGDGKIAIIGNEKITLMNERLETIKEADFPYNFWCVEVLNENLVIGFRQERVLMFLDFSNGRTVHKFTINLKFKIRGVKKITDDTFACLSDHIIQTIDKEGRLINQCSEENLYFKSISKVNDSLVTASFFTFFVRDGYGVVIWDVDGYWVEEMIDYDFVGACSFGYLVRPKNDPLVCEAYDTQHNFVGLVLTDTISSDKINKITQVGSNLFAVLSKKSFKLIKCKIYCFLSIRKENVSR
jgi:hypothetical protein